MTDLQKVLAKDRRALLLLSKKIEQETDKDKKAILREKFAMGLKKSEQAYTARSNHSLSISYPKNLPISEKVAEIKEMIAKHQVVVIAGETGSGKTTQLPKICIELGLANSGQIGHTQPRRIAAESVSKRIAEEVGAGFGDQVGFQVRFREKHHPGTLLKVMTDGILLAEMERDRYLTRYSTLIIDEAHERSLNIDFLLGYLKRLLKKRSDLKLIITSATIDVEKFKDYFKAPYLEVSGRTYPVLTHYLEEEELEKEQSDLIVTGLSMVEEIEKKEAHSHTGDVLVFLAGERDIREAVDAINQHGFTNTLTMPLYSRLNNEAQKKIFHPIPGKRRVILATNIAETSITVPNIRYVIDTGLSRISRYSPHQKIQRLPIERISKASANQRMGRAGRVMAGHCIRLYSQQDFELREDFTEPEILRTNLATVILKALSLRLGSLESFPFVDAPQKKYIRDGLKVLKELKAIDDNHQITTIGRQLVKINLDPRLAKMVISANRFNTVFEVIVIASALSIQDPREFPNEKKEKARQFHQRFKEEGSDFVAWLHLWDYLEGEKKLLSNTQFRKKCREEFLNYLRINEWRDIVREVVEGARGLKLSLHLNRSSHQSIHQSILPGLLGLIGHHDEKKTYRGAHGINFNVLPNSNVYKKPPEWLMVASMVETSLVYARDAASISSEWLLKSAKHLLTYHYSEPHWSDKRGESFVYQKSSLYGLVVEEKKRVRYSPIDPKEAHQLFIREALVNERYERSSRQVSKLWIKNKKTKEKVLELEARLRTSSILKSNDELFGFYQARVPERIVDVRSFEDWLKQDKNSHKILFRDEDLIDPHALLPDDALFPDKLAVGDHVLNLKYVFTPGIDSDGVTVFVPVVLLNQLSNAPFTWLVPGLLPEKITAVLKSLPKAIRKQLFPIESLVHQILLSSLDRSSSLNEFLTKYIFEKKGIKIEKNCFMEEKLEPYYRMNFVILDKNNKALGQGRDLTILKKKYLQETVKVIESALNDKSDKRFQDWSFGDILEVSEKKEGDLIVKYYPALKDEQEAVSLVNFSEREKAQHSHQQGLVRLASLSLKKEIKYLQKNLFKGSDNALLLSVLKIDQKKTERIILAIIKETFFVNQLPRNKDDFLNSLNDNKGQLGRIANQYQTILSLILKAQKDVESKLLLLTSNDARPLKEDISAQLNRLFSEGFLLLPFYYLKSYPRYLKGVLLRLEKAMIYLSKDRAKLSEVHQLEAPFFKRFPDFNSLFLNEKVLHYRFLLEELRVSFFAEKLKTSESVSYKKLTNLCKKL